MDEYIKNRNWQKIILLAQNPSGFISKAKKKGYLRPSKYDFSIDIPCRLISCLVMGCENYGSINRLSSAIDLATNLANDEKGYLKSVLILLRHGCKARKAFNEIEAECKKKNLTAASILYVDSLFYEFNAPRKEMSKEDAASVASYFLSINNIGHLNVQERKEISRFANDNSLSRLISKGHQLQEYRNIEIAIDKYSVTLERVGDSVKLIDNKGYIFAISWGNYKFMAQRNIRYNRNLTGPLPSFETGVQAAYQAINSSGWYQLVKDHGFERFRIAIPCLKLINIRPILRLLRTDIGIRAPYQDELSLIEDVICELHIDETSFDEKFINKQICIWDLIAFRRVLILLYMLTKTKLASVGNNDIAKFNSLLISFQNSTLRRFLELILGSASSDIIDIMTINTSKFCDIQYTPLIENGDQIIIPVGIAAQSNIVRNLILKTESRIDGDGTRDLIHEKLTASLMTQGISTTTFPYSYNRISGDLDTVFIIGDCLFISENKNQLPGTSLHECQNVIEYYEKAKSQKQKFDTLWTTPGFIKYLEGKIGCSLSVSAR